MSKPVLPNPLFQDQNQPDPPASTAGSPECDNSGRPLALRLPDWDLLPPTEFLQRHQDR